MRWIKKKCYETPYTIMVVFCYRHYWGGERNSQKRQPGADVDQSLRGWRLWPGQQLPQTWRGNPQTRVTGHREYHFLSVCITWYHRKVYPQFKNSFFYMLRMIYLLVVKKNSNKIIESGKIEKKINVIHWVQAKSFWILLWIRTLPFAWVFFLCNDLTSW